MSIVGGQQKKENPSYKAKKHLERSLLLIGRLINCHF